MTMAQIPTEESAELSILSIIADTSAEDPEENPAIFYLTIWPMLFSKSQKCD